MILQFPRRKRIKRIGATSSETSTRMGQRLITADSTSANLTIRSTPTEEEEMSYKWMTAVLPLKLPANEKSVLNILAFHANEDGECWPSVRLIASECCLSSREIQKCLAWLQGNNFIEREFRDGRSTVYCVNELLSNKHPHPGPLDIQNGNMNAGEVKCERVPGHQWHSGCLILPPPYWRGEKNKKGIKL